MFHFLIVFEYLFSRCSSLKEVVDLLKLRLLNVEIVDSYISSVLVEECIRTLIFNITHNSRKCDFVSKMNLREMQYFVVRVDYFGRKLSLLKDNTKCVVAGSFALAFFSLLRYGNELFVPNDIDIYKNSEDNQIMNDLKTNFRITVDSDEDAYGTSDTADNTRNISKILARMPKKQKIYNWNEVFRDMNNSRRYSYIDKVYTANCKQSMEIPINIISISIPFYCTQCFSVNIFSQFDMVQCCVSIIGTHGTFYPDIFIENETLNCLDERKICFNEGGAFYGKPRKQYQRIKKYQSRGFGLETDPSKVLRLS